MEMSRLRVLWAIKGLGVGGAEQLLLNAALVADHDRFEYHVAYVRSDKDALVPALREAGVHVWPLASEATSTAAWLRRLRQVLVSQEFNVVHAHSPLIAGVVRVMARSLPRRTRPAVVSTEHNTWDSFGRATRWLNAATNPFDDHRWAVSDRVRQSMWRGAARRTEVLTHGVVLETTQAGSRTRADIRSELGLSDSDVVGITVANLRREKDYPNLLRAAAILRDSVPGLRLLAVGQGPLEAEVRRLHAELELGQRFQLLGFRGDVPDLLRAVDFFVLGSRHEGFPVAVMEALVNGLPVVATAVGGVPEAISHGVEGLVVPPADPAALAEAVRRMATDAELRGEMAERARRRAAEYDIRRAVERLETVYATFGPAAPNGLNSGGLRRWSQDTASALRHDGGTSTADRRPTCAGWPSQRPPQS